MPVTEDGADLASTGFVRPSARWTYLLSETPMRSEHYRQIETFRALIRDGCRPLTEEASGTAAFVP